MKQGVMPLSGYHVLPDNVIVMLLLFNCLWVIKVLDTDCWKRCKWLPIMSFPPFLKCFKMNLFELFVCHCFNHTPIISYPYRQSSPRNPPFYSGHAVSRITHLLRFIADRSIQGSGHGAEKRSFGQMLRYIAANEAFQKKHVPEPNP